MNWLQKTAQDVGDVHDTLVARPNVPDLKEDAGDIPGNTCPDIDKLIVAVRKVLKACNQAQHYDSIDDLVSEIQYELYDVEDQLECLRTSNDRLREIGAYWYGAYKDLEAIAQDAQNQANACWEQMEEREMGD